MPSTDIKEVLETRPLKFQIKTAGGKWACVVHPDRPSYERFRTSSSASVATSSSASSITTPESK
ncbi:uncharacterized protein E0L32_004911 [Thyridium curvatum]|uniref:Uncharacterized protein n=1 Tax=Thyridium curvatum TaxID=1093900 RepID=A0A507BDR9_9PEZI|nr:uncharacterized protein E0L32_004911 [Thyridium curvatum]TPX15081.1 hypothetical protein E0L32_004911 [Thyridium curvatum]